MKNFNSHPTCYSPEQIVYVDILKSHIECTLAKLEEIINDLSHLELELLDKDYEGNKRLLELKVMVERITKEVDWLEVEILNNFTLIQKCNDLSELKQVSLAIFPLLKTSLANNNLFKIKISLEENLYDLRIKYIYSNLEEMLPSKLIVLSDPACCLSIIPNLCLSSDVQPAKNKEDKFFALSNFSRKNDQFNFTYLRGHVLLVEQKHIVAIIRDNKPIIYEKFTDNKLQEIEPQLAKELAHRISFANFQKEWKSVRLLLKDLYELFSGIKIYLQQETEIKSFYQTILLFLAKLSSFSQDQVLILEAKRIIKELAELIIEEPYDKTKVILKIAQVEKNIELKGLEYGINSYLVNQIESKLNNFLNKKLLKIEYKDNKQASDSFWVINNLSKNKEQISFSYLFCDKNDNLEYRYEKIIIYKKQIFYYINNNRKENLSCLIVNKILENLEMV